MPYSLRSIVATTRVPGRHAPPHPHSDHGAVVAQLIAAGADPCHHPALLLAARFNSVSALSAILAGGADVGVEGNAALVHAAYSGRPEAVSCCAGVAAASPCFLWSARPSAHASWVRPSARSSDPVHACRGQS
jgi:hypothetical protein